MSCIILRGVFKEPCRTTDELVERSQVQRERRAAQDLKFCAKMAKGHEQRLFPFTFV